MRRPTRSSVRRLSVGVAAAASLLAASTSLPAVAATSAASKPGIVRGNVWGLRSSVGASATVNYFSFGLSTDIKVTGDWDGNGSKTAGVVRASGTGADSVYIWYLRNSNSAGGSDIKPFAYGQPGLGDTPIVGDWDGNGKDTVGVARRATGVSKLQWLLRNSTTAGPPKTAFTFGRATDRAAVVGDWDGDGTDTPGVVRNTAGVFTWLLTNRNYKGAAAYPGIVYGSSTIDQPVVGDWDGDGRTGIGVMRASGSTRWWLLRNSLSSGGAQLSLLFGLWTDTPVVWQ
jgi:hypothetical protein